MDGPSPRDARSLQPPSVPGVDLLVEIGRGGFGVVWSGQDENGQTIAVKVAHNAAHGPRFAREVEALKQIGPPHVPQLFDSGVLDDGRSYLTMEQLKGETLETRIDKLEKPMAPREAAALACELLDCLNVVHELGFVHRDLKPANVFITDTGVRVMDFGLARFDDGVDLTRTGVIVGTVAYSSPEQLAGAKDVDARADLYSVGVILYQLVSLKLPFDGERAEVERGHLMLRPPTLSVTAAVSVALDELIAELLAKEPERRPNTAALVSQRLATLDHQSMRLTEHVQRKRLGGGAEPVVLLATSSEDVSVAAVIRAVEQHHGFLARERGSQLVAIFSSRGATDPIASATAAARALQACGATVALHLDDVLVRNRAGVATAYGASIEAPDSWISRASGNPARNGLKLTAELAAVAPQLVGLSESESLPPLVGRDDIIAELQSAIGSALDGDVGLVTILGGPGIGKTRLALEASALAREAGATVAFLAGRAATAARLSEQVGVQLVVADRLAQMRSVASAIRKKAALEPLALIIDDAHLASLAALDALELAVAAAGELRLVVVVCADPILEQARPEWGTRADRFRTINVDALDPESAAKLAAHHLQPAEYPPAAALRRLAQWAGCNPRLLLELARSLKTMGAIAKREGGESYYLVTEVLDALPTSRAAQWLESQKLAAMSPDLAAFARLAALVGPIVSVAELEWILAKIDREGGAATRIDPSVGCAELVIAGWLVRVDEQSHEWAREATRDAIYELIRNKDRATLHAHALEYAQAISDPQRIARHAPPVGEKDLAVAALLELVERSHAAQDFVSCDQLATRALALADSSPSPRGVQQASALLGRGRARYRFNRAADAVADLEQAAAIAKQLANPELEFAAHIERGTALDWAYDFEASAASVAEASALLPVVSTELRAAQLMVARARTAWRQDRPADAAMLIHRAQPVCARHGDRDSETICRVLLPMALVVAKLPGGEQAFKDSIRFCEEREDWFHLAALHANRIILWEAEGRLEEGVASLEEAVALARETGHPLIEVVATHNLAELHFWLGNDDRALAIATRSLLLQKRLFPDPIISGPLLLARIHVAMGHADRAAGFLETANDLRASASPTDLLFLEALSGQREWDESIAAAEKLANGEAAIELSFLASCVADADANADERERFLVKARAHLDDAPIWRARLTSA